MRSALLFLIFIFSFSGCADKLNKSQLLSLDFYIKHTKQYCVSQRSSTRLASAYGYKNVILESLCLSKAQRIFHFDKEAFLLSETTLMLDKCESKNKKKETVCLKKYQRKHYDKLLKDVIK